MKFSPADFNRLVELMAKDASDLTDDEKTELNALKAKAPKDDNDSAMTADDVKLLVAEATTTSMKAALRNARTPSKMLFQGAEANEIEFPISHRSGNLSVDAKQLLNVLQRKAINDGIPESVLKDAERRGEAAEKRLTARAGFKALTTSGAGTGAEFMNTGLSSTLLQRLYLESKLASRLLSREVDMPTNPFRFPLGTTRPKFRLNGEGVTAEESTPGSGELVLDAKKLTALVEYTYESDEDSLIAILPHVLQQLGESAGDALEDAIINGDTTATHQDSDTNADAKHGNRAFDGIRKLALAQSALKVSLATGGISAANIGTLRKALGRWGLEPKNLILIAGVNAYNDLVMLPETLTAEKVGAATARVLTGIAPNIFGIDIIPSARMREDLNASGVYDGTTTTKGSIGLIYVPGWVCGVRRGFTVETERDIKSQKNFVVASFRRDLKPVEPLSANNARLAVLGYNFAAAA